MSLGEKDAFRTGGEIDLAAEPPFQLGGLRVDPARLEVQGPAGAEILQPRVMQVLVALAAEAGRVTSRDDLGRRCWGGRVVGEDALNRCVARLRQIASEAPGHFEIETVPRVGYRLIARPPVAGVAKEDGRPVRSVAGDVAASPARPSDGASGPAARGAWPVGEGSPRIRRRPRRWAILTAAAAAFLAALLLALVLAWRGMGSGSEGRGSAASLRSVAILPVRNLTGDPRLDAVAGSLTEDVAHLVGRSGLIAVAPIAAAAADAAGGRGETHAGPGEAAYQVRIDLLRLGPGQQLDLEILDKATGRILDSVQQPARDAAKDEPRVALRLYAEIFNTVVGTWLQKVLKSGRGDADPETLLAHIIAGPATPPTDPAAVQALLSRARAEIKDQGALATAYVASCDELIAGIDATLLSAEARRRLAEAALSDAVQAVAARPLTASSHGCQSRSLAELGRWDDALAAAQWIIDNIGVTAEGYLYKAVVELRLGRYADAARDFSEYDEGTRSVGFGVAGEPSGLGLAYLLAGDPSEALAHLRRTLAAHPNAADARLYEAAALEELGRRDEAAAAAQEYRRTGAPANAWTDLDAPAAPRVRADVKRIAGALRALGLEAPPPRRA